MDNLQTPQSQETKDYLEKECGLKPYQPTQEPNYANPDKMECKSSQLKLQYAQSNLCLLFIRPHVQSCHHGSFIRWTPIRPSNRFTNHPLHFLNHPRPSLLLLGCASQGEAFYVDVGPSQDLRAKLGILPRDSSRLEPRRLRLRRHYQLAVSEQ